ncbi:isoleucine--tRNA ligase, partial [Candidatus Woesearchaeota archaeon]
KKSFYFLDGPPYTSGHVHLGTAWNKSLKDCVLRYLRMRGYDVWDRAGYDMHGLPTARKVQQKLKLETKQAIERFGVARFVEECQRFAIENMKVMNQEFKRLGVWMDFENAYMPITKEYIEGEWWLIKQANKRKRLYQAEKTMHWCRYCSTALAKHELEYKKVTENSIFVKFRIKHKQNEYLVIWTTTPWTIPFNLGVMVHPELDYVRVEVEGEVWVVAKGLVGAFMNGVVGKPYKVLEEFKGAELVGLKYEHPQAEEIEYFRECKNKKIHSVVLSSEYVDLSAGTGLVHMAPGCGPEDYEVGHREGIPPFNNLSEEGVFPKTMGRFAGWVAKQDDEKFIKDLKERGALIAITPVEHDYAHCWRCKQPVIFRTTKQWFFKVEDLIPEMRKLNKSTYWVPDWAGKNWFDSWLEKLRDNSITRQRYWGTPLPVWQCEKCNSYEVIGSLKELEEKAGKLPENLHKPWIDELVWKCKCGGIMKRCPDILDVWIDAGTSSWNCLDFPQKKALFKKLYPPDFILEGKDQIRGWFNLLLVTSMVALGKPAFKRCYMHGFVQDAAGRKMSKSLGNVISPQEVVNKYGADTFRLYSIGGANAGLDLNYNMDDVKTKYRSLVVLWNIHNYLLEYSDGLELKTIKNAEGLELEERYILSRLNSTIVEVTKLLDGFNIDKVPTKLEELFLELSRSYIQFTRDKINEPATKQLVVNTIATVLLNCIKLLAPVTPFIAEQIFQNLKPKLGLKEDSVHLCSWPKPNKALIDKKLEESMGLAYGFIQALLSAREKAGRGVRWPMLEAVIVPSDKSFSSKLKPLLGLIKEHTNIKRIAVKQKFEVEYRVKPNYSTLGKRFGADTKLIVKQLQKLPPEKVVKQLSTKGLRIGRHLLSKEDLIVEEVLPTGWVSGECHYGKAYLSTVITPELEAEGFAREIVRRVQALRKKAGLKRQHKIKLNLACSSELVAMLSKWKQMITKKCGVVELGFNSKERLEHSEEHSINKHKIVISLSKV